MKPPLVTIGISFYNAEATLADAVRSVFAQTCANWELILVDDGSTDGSLDIAKSIEDPRVRVVSDGENKELSYRLNQIGELARGEYVARMDADDVMHPTRIQRQVEFLEDSPRTDVLGTGVYTIDGKNNVRGMRGCEPLRLTARRVLCQAPLVHPTVMSRAAWYRTHRYDGRYYRAEDYELWCRVFIEQRTRMDVLPEPLLFYREQGSLTLAKLLWSHRTVRRIFRTYGPQLMGKTAVLRQIAKSYCKSLAWCIGATVGADRFLIRRRNRLVNNVKRAIAEAELRCVLETAVPGLSTVTDHVSSRREKAA